MSSSRQLVVPLVLTSAFALLSMTSTGAVTPSSDDAAAVERLQLKTNAIELSVTPAFGGRVLSFNLRGQPNVLKLGAAVEQQPAPEVSATAGDIAYFGHDVWVGPQSQWWLHQQLNRERQAAAAVWPPDPYLSLAQTRVSVRRHDVVEFEGCPAR